VQSYHLFASAELSQFRSDLLRWYSAERRRLPWRGDPPPYGVAGKQQLTKQKEKK
jgi:adenine-specific DNA glycosylase